MSEKYCLMSLHSLQSRLFVRFRERSILRPINSKNVCYYSMFSYGKNKNNKICHLRKFLISPGQNFIET